MPDYEGTGSQVRRRFRDLEPLAPAGDPNRAIAEYVSLAPATPLGHEEVTVDTTAVGLPNIPEDCRRVVLYSLDEEFVYCDDGTDPDATHGMPIPSLTHFIYDTDPDENFKMWAAAATEIRIAYYG